MPMAPVTSSLSASKSIFASMVAGGSPERKRWPAAPSSAGALNLHKGARAAMTTKIFLVRHAEAEGNLFRVAHGQYDSVITPQGYRQLAYLRERFREERLDAVDGSDLTSSRETAVLSP